MVFNEDIIFIHIGKTGGMSCASYLLNNLQSRPVYNCHKFAKEELAKKPIDGVIPLSDTERHWTLEQAIDYIGRFNGKQLSDFKKIFAVVRNPFSIEYSFYHHMKKPQIRLQRGAASKPIFDLADGDFGTFVKHAGYHAPGKTQDDFVRINGVIPDNVEFIKFESINSDFANAVSAFTKSPVPAPLESRNKTSYDHSLEESLSEEIKNNVYKKHQYLFDSGMYSLHTQSEDTASQSSAMQQQTSS